ncbi:Single-stranded-DNA-specific exonuclease recJ [Serratia rubidaea]|uniref:Single-stranded-DNA-specific exonuclease RecJ n=1 Tax=Serratia rubidaea TaxID=61652 RepID=A0A3S4JPQ4_SERRU|nr:Single-stranded-DNA-specific exonuclease recJ [Serratia rubidaea]
MSIIKTQLRRREAVGDVQLSAQLHPLLRRLYALRGVSEERELERSVKGMLPWQQLDGIDAAVDILQQALADGRRIMIVGDFDADGATSTALTALALRSMGGGDVQYLVPNRFEDGYGLSPEVVEQAAARGAELIVTVDNGISSHAGVEVAHAKGMQVLVTDHHLPGETLPAAEAIVNPNLRGCAFPSKALAGVGVAFYLMLALRARLRDSGWFEQRALAMPNLAELLDLVALGTVADVVPLDANNRILVYQGLNRIRAGKCRPGIRALLEVANREARNLAANDLGFALGPRLNAAGRLDDMSIGVALLLSDDIAQARMLANDLDALNQTRREIEQACRLKRCSCATSWSAAARLCLTAWRCTIRSGIRAWSAFWPRASKSVFTAR